MTNRFRRPVRPIHFNIGLTIASGVTACPSTSLLLTLTPEAVTCKACKRTKAYREAVVAAPQNGQPCSACGSRFSHERTCPRAHEGTK